MSFQAQIRIGLLATGLAATAGLLTGCATSSSTPTVGNLSEAWWYEGEAVMRDVDGRVDVSTDGQSWASAQAGQVIPQGSQVRTGPGGSVRLDLGPHGGGILKLMPESQVKLAQLGAAHAEAPVVAVLDLTQGRVVGDTLRLPPPRKIQVRTPAGTQEIP